MRLLPLQQAERLDHLDIAAGGASMNHDRIQGRWKQIKGKVREQWGRLTDDDLDVIAGQRDQLLGRIQERHGLAETDRQARAGERSQPDFSFDETRGPSDRTR
jgi:uncharacterized protein YjbJ (UPF0337 family)